MHHTSAQPVVKTSVSAVRGFAAVLLGFAALTTDLQDSFSQTRTPNADQTPATASTLRKNTIDAEELQRYRQTIGPHLWFRERLQRQRVEVARRQLNAGQTVDALRHLQRLLDEPEDRFLFDGTRQTPTGLRQLAFDMLTSLDTDSLATYDRMYSGKAETLLQDAVKTGDDRLLGVVLQRYPLTTSALEAGQRLALQAFDRGEFERAVVIWERLRAIPQQRRRLPATTTLQLALAYQKLGRDNEVRRLAREIESTPITVAGRSTTAGDILFGSKRVTSNFVKTDWRLPLGNAARNGEVDTSTPFLRPIWSVELGGGKADRLRNAVRSWVKEQDAKGQSSAVVQAPLIVGSQIITRDVEGIRAFHSRNGQALWTYPTSSTQPDVVLQSFPDEQRLGTTGLGSAGIGFRRGYAGNSILQTLTSDGRRVFFVDDMKPLEIGLGASPRFFGRRRRGADEMKPTQGWNRIVAVDVPASARMTTDKPALRPARWAVGGPEKSDRKPTTDSLTGHFFLGPPLPLMERLYAVSEFQKELHLICLEAATGRLVWRQRVATVEGSVWNDPDRYHRSCTPSYADGVLVLPTGTGFLMAADPLSGSLLWAAFCGNHPDELQNPRALQKLGAEARHIGFLSAPVLHAGRVVHLSPDSNDIRCFSLRSGQAAWSTPREDGEYIAAVDDATVIVVGRRYTRGIAFTTGRPLWSTHTGTPAGRGFANRLHYLLPLESGRVMTIVRQTGRVIGLGLAGTTTPNDRNGGVRWRPGNLVASGDMIVSADAGRIQAFPSAKKQFAVVEKRLQSTTNSLNDLLTGAELALLLGDLDKAERMLTVGLQQIRIAPLRQAEANRTTQQAMQNMLHELLYAKLQARPNDAVETFARLDRLSHTPVERGRFLMARAEFSLEQRDAKGLLHTIDELAELDLDQLFPMPGRESHLVSVSAWVPSLLRRARKRFGSAIPLELERRSERMIAAQDIGRLDRFVRVFGSFSQVEPARAELAKRCLEAGQLQRAELLLLANRSSPAPHIAGTAARRLFQLWQSHGLHNLAAGQLQDLGGRYAEVVVSDNGMTGGQFAKSALTDTRTRAARRRSAGPPNRVNRVSIQETRWLDGDEELQTLYSQFRQVFPTPENSPFDLLDLGLTVNTELTVVHRETGTTAGRIRIPSRHSYPLLPQNSHVGQFFGLGSAGRMHGVSLLEVDRGRPVWTASAQGFGQRDDLFLVGPTGPTFVVFQARDSLIAVEPGTGRLLWQRNDIPASGGLHSDPYSGLFGDEHALVLFAEDRSKFTVYDTVTGEILRRGSLPISDQHERRLFGRRLFYVSDDGREKRLRIWDSVTGRHLLDQVFQDALFTTSTARNELVVLHSHGVLQVIDVSTGVITRSLRFDAPEIKNITYLKAFREGERLIVNIQRPVSVPDRFFSFYAGDTFGPAEHVRGELYAYSLTSGRRLWKRTIPQRTVLRPRTERLPFLILVSRIRDRTRGTRAALLVEAIDSDSGRTIGIRNDLLPDRILKLCYNAERDAVEIRGTHSTIRLHLRQQDLRGPGDAVKL